MIADLEPIFAARARVAADLLRSPGSRCHARAGLALESGQMLSILHRSRRRSCSRGGSSSVAGNSYGGSLTLASHPLDPRTPPRSGAARSGRPGAGRRRAISRRPVTITTDPVDLRRSRARRGVDPRRAPVHERRMLDEIRAHDMPAYRVADYAVSRALEANYLLTGDVGRPGRRSAPSPDPHRSPGRESRVPAAPGASSRSSPGPPSPCSIWRGTTSAASSVRSCSARSWATGSSGSTGRRHPH